MSAQWNALKLEFVLLCFVKVELCKKYFVIRMKCFHGTPALARMSKGLYGIIIWQDILLIHKT